VKPLSWTLCALLYACSTPEDGRTTIVAPSETEFVAVEPVLVRSCGTLDCHGTQARNMRLYGFGGLRESANLDPLTAATTTAEIALSYRSVVSLEPEILRAVVQHSTAPESLTLLRKGRGSDNHKGGTRLVGALDTCLTSWLNGSVDAEACKRAQQ
jgi:hypothetical protein